MAGNYGRSRDEQHTNKKRAHDVNLQGKTQDETKKQRLFYGSARASIDRVCQARPLSAEKTNCLPRGLCTSKRHNPKPERATGRM
jgi:hypothetical protein